MSAIPLFWEESPHTNIELLLSNTILVLELELLLPTYVPQIKSACLENLPIYPVKTPVGLYEHGVVILGSENPELVAPT